MMPETAFPRAEWQAISPRLHELDDAEQVVATLVARANREGEHLLAVEIGDVALPLLEPSAARDDIVRQVARALAIMGSPDAALEHLDSLDQSENASPYTFGHLGRVHKDRAAAVGLSAERVAELRQLSFDAYRRGYEASQKIGDDGGAAYNGINAAFLAILLGEEKDARTYAEAAAALAMGDDYFALATRAEAALVVGDEAAARDLYRRTSQIGSTEKRWDALASTRRQCQMLAKLQLGRATALDDCFDIGAIAIIGGEASDIDDPEPTIQRALDWLATSKVRILITTARPGWELDVVEAVAGNAELDIDLHVVLPGDAESIVSGAEPSHSEALRKVLACSVAVDVCAREPQAWARDDAYRDTFAAARTALLAKNLSLPVRPLWIGENASAHALSLWQHRFPKTHRIDPKSATGDGVLAIDSPVESKPFPQALGALAADANRACFLVQLHFPSYATLDEQGYRHFQKTVLPAMAGCLARSEHPSLSRAGFGADYALLYDGVQHACQAAVELQRALADVVAGDALPALCLHAGPTRLAVNPVLNYYGYEGELMAHTLELAHALPAGGAYASDTFVAFTALETLHGLRFEHAGRLVDSRSPVSLFRLHF